MKNKRYFGILVIVTTMLSTMVLLSCSHDDFSNNQEAAEQAANQQYAAAFVKAFGQVAPTVDWGFSSHPANARNLTRGVSTYASCRGSLQPTIPFPTDCDDSNFLDAVPAGVNKLPTWGAGPGSYYIDAEKTVHPYVSLGGMGGYVVLEMANAIEAGDKIDVLEIGACDLQNTKDGGSQKAKAEEIQISISSTGETWKIVGKHSADSTNQGILSFTISSNMLN